MNFETAQEIVYGTAGEKHFARLCARIDHMAPTPVDQDLCIAFLNTIRPMLMIAPGSTSLRFHHAWQGGLLEHILEVETLAREVAGLMPHLPQQEISKWNIMLAAMIHDLHKACDWSGRAYYVPNTLKGGKQSEAIPFKTSDVAFSFIGALNGTGVPRAVEVLLTRNRDQMPGGELSLLLVQSLASEFYSRIPECVKFAVRHHEGAYSSLLRWELAGKETPLQQILHFADMISSRAAGWKQPSPA